MLASGSAAAQSLSGRGVISHSQAEVACISEIERLVILVEKLVEQRDTMIACNDQDMVFAGTGAPGADADGCVPLALNQVRWDSTTDPSELTFEDSEGNPLTTISVLRGKPGPRGTCPPSHPIEVTP